MPTKPIESSRRNFLKAGAAAALAPSFVGSTAKPTMAATSAHGLPTRKFGKTGVTLPVFGMGGSAMVAIYIRAYGVNLISLDERVKMVRHAYDKGVRYFDTARVYAESEKIMGQGLKGVRDDVFVATKVAAAPGQVRKSLETSLKQLDMDYVDVVQIHSPVIERMGFEGGMKIHKELEKLRDEKMLRFIGLTTHVAYETVFKMIATGEFDQALLAYGYFNKGMDTLLSHQNLEWRAKCLAKAHELDMAIVSMKVMGASIMGHNAKNIVPGYDPSKLDGLPAAAIRWVLQDERVSMLNIGVSLPQDIDRNVALLKEDLTYTNDDRMLLADFSGRAYESAAVKPMRTV